MKSSAAASLANPMADAAIAHASMLFQVAAGQCKEPPERTRLRFEMLVAFIRTGSCQVSQTDKALAEQITTWLTTQPQTAE